MVLSDSEFGLYRREEHDACGTGFVAQLDAPPSHRVVEQALECLQCLSHRGGVGISVQLPREFFAQDARRLNAGFKPGWKIGVGVFFFPQDGIARARPMFTAEEVVHSRGLVHVGSRQVSLDRGALGPQARETQPAIWHMLIAQPADREREFQQLLYLARKEIEDGHLDACQLLGGKVFRNHRSRFGLRAEVFRRHALAGRRAQAC